MGFFAHFLHSFAIIEMIKLYSQTTRYFPLSVIASCQKTPGIPVSIETFDAVIAVGALSWNHVSDDAFPEILRITKKGKKYSESPKTVKNRQDHQKR